MHATMAVVMVAWLATGLAPAGARAGERGLTWGKYVHDASLGIERIGCLAGGFDCNAYTGDTSCQVKLPVLCLKQDGSPRPNYDVPDESHAAREAAFYHGWAGGQIAATVPVRGDALDSAATADGLCERKFGAGWRMAEFHDGRYVSQMDQGRYYGDGPNWHSASPWTGRRLQAGGWAFYAYGNVDEGTRYWVRINDQPANCWN